ncbi:MAG TPA: zf-HC2 domain-containing protein [Jatrophihabitantaceae bacterium]|jgi:anti-sigma factor RsiW|nr:zf-HC2 domain-containing protein [Jatrophihabitantaceae bacterium]
MIANLRSMLTCRWAARRIQRYLDSDPSASLDPAEVDRIEAHLAECGRCTGRVEEYRALSAALRRWSAHRVPDPALVARVRDEAERLIVQGSE